MSRVKNGETDGAFYPQEGVAVTCRSYREYAAMFALNEAALMHGPILDAAGGASSFAAEAIARGCAVTTADPRYALPADSLYEESVREIAVSTAKLDRLKEHYDWTFYGSPETHRKEREASLERFIGHYRSESGRRTYTAASLPELPFADDSFSLVLCSHFLFLYEEQFSPDFHRDALRELYRVTKPGGEIRVYPVQTLRFARYSALDDLVAMLESLGATARLLPSRLTFIPGSTDLLQVTKQK